MPRQYSLFRNRNQFIKKAYRFIPDSSETAYFLPGKGCPDAMEKVSYQTVACMCYLMAVLLSLHPGRVFSANIKTGPNSPLDTTGQKTEPDMNSSTAPQQNAPNSRLLTPFRHLQVGASAGLTATRIIVSGSANDIVRRFMFGADIRPLPFLSIKASMSNAKVSDITNSHDTITAQSTVTFRAGNSSNTYFKTYAAGANVTLPILFWKNWPETLSETKQGVFFTLGGIREWITITDHYLVDSLGNSTVRTMAEITGSVKEQRWSGSAGVLYRHPLPHPFKGWLEVGGDYVRPYNKTIVFYGTQETGDGSPPSAISRTVTVNKEFPVQVKASLLFKVY